MTLKEALAKIGEKEDLSNYFIRAGILCYKALDAEDDGNDYRIAGPVPLGEKLGNYYELRSEHGILPVEPKAFVQWPIRDGCTGNEAGK